MSAKKIRVLNKYGGYAKSISKKKAEFSVRSDKSCWVNDHTIQVLYHHDDEKRFKHEVWERDQYICYLCGEQLHEGHPELTVDHVYPRRLGGSILPKNMACCCRPCNEQKGHRTLKSYFYHLYAGLSFMVLWWSKTKEGGLSSGNESQKEKETEYIET
jgi:hypothetical protein